MPKHTFSSLYNILCTVNIQFKGIVYLAANPSNIHPSGPKYTYQSMFENEFALLREKRFSFYLLTVLLEWKNENFRQKKIGNLKQNEIIGRFFVEELVNFHCKHYEFDFFFRFVFTLYFVIEFYLKDLLSLKR